MECKRNPCGKCVWSGMRACGKPYCPFPRCIKQTKINGKQGDEMARDFAIAFYSSKLWEDTRDYIRKRDRYICQRCGALGEEVHHKVHLSPENINDLNITINPDNLILLCHSCHMKEHGKFQAMEFDSDGMPVRGGG